MDHFWLDRDGQREPEIVPLVGLVIYDGGDWARFPERLGYNLDFYTLVRLRGEDGQDGNDHHISTQMFYSMLQEWLFIGSLIEIFRVLGLTTSREDFISSRDGALTLYTGRLAELFRRLMLNRTDEQLPWTPDMREDIDLGVMMDELLTTEPPDLAKARRLRITETRSPEQFVQAMNKDVDTLRLQERNEKAAKAARNSPETRTSLIEISRILETATSFLDNSDRYLIANGMREVAGSAHMLSSILILESMEKMTEILLRRALMVPTFGMLRHSEAVEKRFRESGLCLTRRNHLVRPTRCYVASTLIRPVRNDHSPCTSYSCNVIPTDFAELPRHRDDCNGRCGKVCLDDEQSKKLYDLLDEGSFGVIEINTSHQYIRTLRVRDSRDCPNGYIVFSHVWYGMPRKCQVDYRS